MKQNIRKASLWCSSATIAKAVWHPDRKIQTERRQSPGRSRRRKEGTENWGNVVVIENVFAFKQVFPLHEGDNVIGRRSKGTEADIPIESNDPSMDRRHCILNVKRDKQGQIVYTLRDNNSITGTFLMNELLGPKERVRIEEGNIFTLGATTLILRGANSNDTSCED